MQEVASSPSPDKAIRSSPAKVIRYFPFFFYLLQPHFPPHFGGLRCMHLFFALEKRRLFYRHFQPPPSCLENLFYRYFTGIYFLQWKISREISHGTAVVVVLLITIVARIKCCLSLCFSVSFSVIVRPYYIFGLNIFTCICLCVGALFNCEGGICAVRLLDGIVNSVLFPYMCFPVALLKVAFEVIFI